MSKPSTPPPRRDESLGRENENTLLEGVEDAPRPDAARTRRGLGHLVAAILALAGCFALPYATPALARFRPWVPGEGIPVLRMFAPEAPTVHAMAVATGGATTRAAGRSDAESAADTLGEAVAANLEEPEAASPPPLVRRGGAGPEVRIAPEELEGLVEEIEGRRALEPFYRALHRTARGEPGALTRVAHYGDSSIAGDGITMTLRRRFQRRFGDGGHGFVLMARGDMPYRHHDLFHEASGPWDLRKLVRGALSSHRYGYGGVQYRAAPGARAVFATSERGPVGHAVSRFELFFLRHPRGGRVELRLDRGERETITTHGEVTRSAAHRVEVPDGAHRLEVRVLGGGESRLFGVVLEREGPGVVYDSLGMVGARGRRMLRFAPAHFAEQHALRQTDLIVLGFGGNDADDYTRGPADFEEDYRQVIRMVREARPEAGCLLLAPLDQGERGERGGIRTIPLVPVIVDAQRRAAAAEGCAFFDTFRAMGGEGSMRRWWRARPRLAFGDFRHATPAGYRVIGNMLYKALLAGFAEFLREGPAR